MATLKQVMTESKALEQVAVQLKNAMLFYAPKDTGNLKRMLNKYNKPSSILKVTGSGNSVNVKFRLVAGPPNARYGQWFNDPPRVVSEQRRSLKKTAERKGNWNFKENAKKSTAVKMELQKWKKSIAPSIVKLLAEKLKIK